MSVRKILVLLAAVLGLSAADARPLSLLVRDLRTVKDGRCVVFNIGTAAHAPSSVAQVLKAWPDADVTLWADAPLEDGYAAMIRRRFPNVGIVWGDLEDPAQTNAALEAAVRRADALVIGSSSGVFGRVGASARQFRARTGKPVGALAMGTPHADMKDYAFAFFRDEQAFANGRKKGWLSPVTGFAPDSVFDFDCRDEAGADAFLRAHGLEAGKFVCAIPGNRRTPRWTFWGTEPDERTIAENAAHVEADHAPLRAAIVEAVRTYGQKVLICAEQRTELDLIRPYVYDKLPEDVRRNCAVQESFWMPDLALSVYLRSRLVFGIEMHSQVMALGSGVPAVLFHHPGFGTKADMWRTIGCGNWRVDLTEAGATKKAVDVVGGILADPSAAAARCRAARAFLDRSEREMFDKVAAGLSSPGQDAVPPTTETGPEAFRALRRQLRAFHPDECHGRCKAPEFETSFQAIRKELDAFVAAHPDFDALDLRKACYLAERRHFAPFLFTESPFYFTAGVNGGWVVNNNPSWYVRTVGHKFFTEACGVPPEALQRRDDRVNNRFSVCCGTFTDTGHHQPAYRRILKLGFGGIRREVEAALASCPADDPHGRKTLETALVGLDTVHEIQLKFAEKARAALAAGGLPERTRRWYARIAESAARCPWEPPRTFYEGLNALWFIREALGYVDNTLCNSLGRPDAWLIDLYRRDLAEGRLTEDEARDLICRFMVHADCHHDGMIPVKGYADHEAEIPIVLGGCDSEGRPVYNELTRMFLDEHLRCALVFPKLHVRYSADSPQEYLLKIGTMLMKDHAVFAMFNDDIHIPQFEKLGLSAEDARAYLACGCWDGFVDGVTDIDAANYLSTVRILELTIYREPELERRLGLRIDPIDGATSYEEVRDTVYRNFIRFARGVMSDYTRYGRTTAYVTPYPVHSMCYRGAPQKRRDLNEGGAIVSPRIMTLAFLANTVDSLLAIKRVCFDEKLCTLPEFLAAVRGNWSGEAGERLRRLALASPYWGDHSAESDGLMRWWVTRVSEDIEGFSSGNESPYVLAMWIYREFVLWGEKTRATPDGRHDGDRLAQGLSPSEYRCKEGVTTVVNAIGTLPHERLYASNANLSFDKTAMTAEILAAVFRVTAEKRLHLLQPNCTSVEELIDAKEHPERHQDLIVKVCGFSARFIALSPKFQDEVIARHRLK